MSSTIGPPGSQLEHQVIEIAQGHRQSPEQRHSSQLHVGYRGFGPSRHPPLGSQNTKRQYPGIAIGRNEVSVDHKRKPVIGGPFPPNGKPAARCDPEACGRFTLDRDLQIQRLPAGSGAGTQLQNQFRCAGGMAREEQLRTAGRPAEDISIGIAFRRVPSLTEANAGIRRYHVE